MGFLKAVGFALSGLKTAVCKCRNLRIHIACAFYVTVFALITRAGAVEWIAILFCFFIVIASELYNTAIEHLADDMNKDFSENIKCAKDISAGGVLLAALTSIAVGGIIFFNSVKIDRVIDFVRESTGFAVLIALTLIPLVIWVRKKDRGSKWK